MTLELFALDPVVADVDFTLYHGDALAVVRELADDSVDCVVTSPPYWGLRDYDAGEHELGHEPSVDDYVGRLVELFAGIRRVLAPHGTVWLNLGDGYGANTRGASPPPNVAKMPAAWDGSQKTAPVRHPTKPKDLVGVPWRVAFALQADGWYLRADVIEEVELFCPCGCGYRLEERVWRYGQDRDLIWSKPNPMPESAKDRPTKAHEYVFLLTRRPRYFYDAFAIAEPAVEGTDLGLLRTRRRANGTELAGIVARRDAGVDSRNGNPSGMRNARSVWAIPTMPYAEAHFATFPLELARRCIAAGCPEHVCRTCGRPRERVVERERVYDHTTTAPTELERRDVAGAIGEHDVRHGVYSLVTPVGWTDCGHGDYRAGVVFDPFLGSGTVALAARNLGRHAVGVELSAAYCELARRRTAQLSLFAEPPTGVTA